MDSAGRAHIGTEDSGPWEDLLRSRIQAQHARICRSRFVATNLKRLATNGPSLCDRFTLLSSPQDAAEWSDILREQDEIMRLTGRHALSPELRQSMYELYLAKKEAEEAAAAAARQEAEEAAAALAAAKKAEEEVAAAAERARIDAQHSRIERFISTSPQDPAEWSNIQREQDEIMRSTGRRVLSPELRQCLYELYLMKKAAEEAVAAEALAKQQEAEEEASAALAAAKKAEEEAAAVAEAAAKKAVAWWEAEAAIQMAAEEAAAKHAADEAAAAAEKAVEEEVAAKQANSPPATRPVPASPGERE